MCLWQMKLCKASSIEERAEGGKTVSEIRICLLYTSDAADD